MADGLVGVDVPAVRTFVHDLVGRNRHRLHLHPDPVRWMMSLTMDQFGKNGLNPIYLRPMVVVAIHGDDTLRYVGRLFNFQLDSLRPYADASLNARIDALTGAMASHVE